MKKIIHDLKNKLCILSGQSFRLGKKYGKDEVAVIETALQQIDELLEKLIQTVSDELDSEKKTYTLKEFIFQLRTSINKTSQAKSIEVNSYIDFAGELEGKDELSFDLQLFNEAIENVFKGALESQSRTIDVYMMKFNNIVTIQFIASGSEKLSMSPRLTEVMEKLNAKVKIIPRTDEPGMIIKLLFPVLSRGAMDG